MTQRDFGILVDADLPEAIREVLGKTVKETVPADFHALVPEKILRHGVWGEPTVGENRAIVRRAVTLANKDATPEERQEAEEEMATLSLAACLRHKDTGKPLLSVKDVQDLSGRCYKVLVNLGNYPLRLMMAGNEVFEKALADTEGKPPSDSSCG